MANSNLRKIILEELHKVLNEQGVDTPYGSSEKVSMGPAPSAKVAPKKVGDPKVKKLQNLLASVGLNVGKIDGIPGPLLYKAISQVAQVPEQRVAKDFASSAPNAADNYVTVIGSDPQKSGGRSSISAAPQVSKTPTKDPEDLLPTQQISPETQEEKERREKVRKNVKSKIGKGPIGEEPKEDVFQESTKKELAKMLKNL